MHGHTRTYMLFNPTLLLQLIQLRKPQNIFPKIESSSRGWRGGCCVALLRWLLVKCCFEAGDGGANLVHLSWCVTRLTRDNQKKHSKLYQIIQIFFSVTVLKKIPFLENIILHNNTTKFKYFGNIFLEKETMLPWCWWTFTVGNNKNLC